MKRLLFFFAVLLSTSALGKSLESLYWMTEEYPPYNYAVAANRKGITVDVLMEMFKKTGTKVDRAELHILPWARSYKYLQENPDSALFTMSYTAERQKLFKFVGPIMFSKIVLITEKSRNINIESIADIKKLKIGAVRDDIGEQLARKLGIINKARTDDSVRLVNMLGKKRIDGIVCALEVAMYQMKNVGMDFSQYHVSYLFEQTPIGYAFHKDTPEELLIPLQNALDELKKDGTVDKIKEDYVSGTSSL